MLNLKHKNLDVWKLSIDIIRDLYKMTDGFPKSEIFGITNQIRRSAVSLPLNIAEGSSRKSSLERKRFYEIARSSLVELDTQLEVSMALKYIDNNNMSIVDDKLNHLFAMLTNLIKKT